MSGYIMDLRKIVGHRPLMMVGGSVIVEDEQGRVLLQLRTDNHCWGYAGGAVELYEDVEEAAKRELFEETGLSATAENCRLIQSVRGGCSFSDVWLFEMDFSPEDIKLQQEETSGFMLKTAQEILAMEQEGTLAPCGDIRDFFTRVGDIV